MKTRSTVGGRRGAVLLVGVAALACGAAALPDAGAAASVGSAGPANPAVVRDLPASGAGHARGVRLTLLLSLGVALAGGVVAQYQALNGGAQGRSDAPRPGGSGRGTTTAGQVTVPQAIARPDAPRPPRALPAPNTDHPASPPAQFPHVARHEQAARQRCAEAIAAAFVYDRARTLEAFSAALAGDPAVQPTTVPGFWEMPSSGHADLARAYLRQGRPLDARSVLTVALLTFEHNRELTALLRETAPHRAA